MAYTLLVVDDVPSVLMMIRDAMASEPYRIRTAQSGEEALKILSREPVDVIITDEKMPGMSGSDLLAEVRNRYPDTVRMMLTGNATLASAIRAINEGEIYRFFTKPCNIVDLRVSIRQALERKELIRENRRLSRLVKRQSDALDVLEQQCPGITDVKRDADGAIIIEE